MRCHRIIGFCDNRQPSFNADRQTGGSIQNCEFAALSYTCSKYVFRVGCRTPQVKPRERINKTEMFALPLEQILQCVVSVCTTEIFFDAGSNGVELFWLH